MAADSTVKPIARAPLTESDLMDLAMADVSVELPWTRNRVVRDPAPSQGPGWLESAEVSDGDGFTRASLTFSDIAFFPGYAIDFVDAGTGISCGGQEKPLGLSGQRALVIHLQPANAHDEKGVRVPVRTRSLATERFTEGGVVCDLDNNVVWTAGLNSGDQVRVLELRNPNRLVVDIR
ncbi:MAG TPA: hypothetical protein VJ997_08265 [Longimicrobiales bacterium]|nr:hypothetical protein [Longimicrobiales bacterium]